MGRGHWTSEEHARVSRISDNPAAFSFRYSGQLAGFSSTSLPWLDLSIDDGLLCIFIAPRRHHQDRQPENRHKPDRGILGDW